MANYTVPVLSLASALTGDMIKFNGTDWVPVAGIESRILVVESEAASNDSEILLLESEAASNDSEILLLESECSAVRADYLPLAGGTMVGNIVMPDGGTIGQAAGPLLTFDDSNNYLEITGCKVGIGTATPENMLTVADAGATASARMSFDAYSEGLDYKPTLYFRKSHSNTLNALVATVNNEEIGAIFFYGVDSGNARDTGAHIRVVQNGDAGSKVPCDMIFETYGSSSTNANQLVLEHSGDVGINVANPVSRLHIEDAAFPTLRLHCTANDTAVGLRLKALGPGGEVGFADIYSIFTDANIGYMSFKPNYSMATEALRLDTNGNAGIGQTSFGTNMTKGFAQATGVAPTTSPADCFQMYSADFNGVAGAACPHFRTEDDIIIKLNQNLATDSSPTFASVTHGETEIHTDTVDIPATEIKALRASPKELVAAPGANKLLEFVSAMLILNAGSEVLTESAYNLAIFYDSASGPNVTNTIETTGFIDQATDTMNFVIPVDKVGMGATNIVNKNLALKNLGGAEFGGNASNDAAIRVIITYKIYTSLGL